MEVIAAFVVSYLLSCADMLRELHADAAAYYPNYRHGGGVCAVANMIEATQLICTSRNRSTDQTVVFDNVLRFWLGSSPIHSINRGGSPNHALETM